MAQIDYSKFTSFEETTKELEKRKTTLHRLVKLHDSTKEDKKAQNSAYNDTLKEIKEQMDEEVQAIDGLIAHSKTI